MPVYEYRCSNCGKRFSQLVGMTADSREPACPKCGSTQVRKLVSRFSRLRSEDEVLDSLEGAAMGGNMDDPKSMSRLMREMGKDLDEDLGGDMDEFIDETEREMYDGES